jgi:SHS2 domain-containing protein
MHRWIEHTADLELELEAGSEEEVLTEGLRAVAGLLGEAEGPLLEREVVVEAADRATLLADWLEELLFLAESEGLVPVDAHQLRIEGARLDAKVLARRGRPRPYVKAVTYHGLRFERDGEGWRARVVLDV